MLEAKPTYLHACNPCMQHMVGHAAMSPTCKMQSRGCHVSCMQAQPHACKPSHHACMPHPTYLCAKRLSQPHMHSNPCISATTWSFHVILGSRTIYAPGPVCLATWHVQQMPYMYDIDQDCVDWPAIFDQAVNPPYLCAHLGGEGK